MSDLKAALDALKADLDAMPLPDRWVYRDLPRMTPEYFDKFIEVVGVDNIEWLTRAEYPDGAKRGQLFISPAGMNRLKAHTTKGQS